MTILSLTGTCLTSTFLPISVTPKTQWVRFGSSMAGSIVGGQQSYCYVKTKDSNHLKLKFKINFWASLLTQEIDCTDLLFNDPPLMIQPVYSVEHCSTASVPCNDVIIYSSACFVGYCGVSAPGRKSTGTTDSQFWYQNSRGRELREKRGSEEDSDRHGERNGKDNFLIVHSPTRHFTEEPSARTLGQI